LFFKNLQLRSIAATCYTPPAFVLATPAIAAPRPVLALEGASYATGTSADVAGTHHPPGGHAAMELQPPVLHQYPSFRTAFGQSIADVVGRSRKSEALKILKAFDDSTAQAQTYVTKAAQYITMANDLMAKSHHEYFSAIQKLLAYSHAGREAANERRRGKRRKKSKSRASGSLLQFSTYSHCNY